MNGEIDILFVSYRRPEYTEMALRRLLDTCDERMRVWLWHNGDHGPTLEVVRGLSGHPRVHTLHHSEQNQDLREPTNWLWQNAKGDLVSKVDDDCLMPDGWGETLRRAHFDVPELGVVGCWRFFESDFQEETASRKIKSFAGGHRLMLNCWVEGSGYAMKRRCTIERGPLEPKQSFPAYCIRVANRGYVNGWYFPFLFQEHMDDPRSIHCTVKSDADLQKSLPRMARKYGIHTLAGWQKFFEDEAAYLQRADPDPRRYVGWRAKLARLRTKLAGGGPRRV
jgi:hypothetical protein